MTDRGRDALHRTPDSLRIGPSSMRWEAGRLIVDIDEVASPPVVGRIRGTITLTPQAITGVELCLTADGAHVWRPFSPAARVEVDLGRRGSWTGHGYFDGNFGLRALEADFAYWSWGRYPVSDGTACIYDATLRDGTRRARALHISTDGDVSDLPDAPPTTRFRRSLWGVRRETRCDAGYRPRQTLGMLDAPFYSRSAVTTRLNGHETTGTHEALDLDRFRGPWLMPMLALRVPRASFWPL